MAEQDPKPSELEPPVNADPAVEALVRCDVTGEALPMDETVVIQGYRVGATGKQVLLDRLHAGERLPGEFVRPGVLRRCGCMVLDGVLMWCVAVAVMIPLFVAFGLDTGAALVGQYTDVTAALVTAAGGALGTAIGVAYFTLMHARLGQTVGKMAGRIKLVQNNGRPVTMAQAFWRAMIYTGINFLAVALLLVSVVDLAVAEALHAIANVLLSLFILLNIIVALVDRQQQRALHDRLVGTRVIMVD